MQYALLEVDLELLLRQESDDARPDEVDEALRVAVHLIIQRPLVLGDYEAEDLYLALGVLVPVSRCLLVARDALQRHCLVAGQLLRDIF